MKVSPRFACRILGGVVLVGLAGPVSAADTATANATATIITPIAIATDTDLAFGELAAGTGGTVTVDTAGARSVTGDVTLVSASSGAAAGFTVTGQDGYTYTITLPASATLSGPSGASMTVDGFTSNPNGTGTLAGGTQSVSVGATLNVGNNQTAGVYTGSFSVSVDYN